VYFCNNNKHEILKKNKKKNPLTNYTTRQPENTKTPLLLGLPPWGKCYPCLEFL